MVKKITKPCRGWDGHKCPTDALIPNLSRFKRCTFCAKKQHRLVVNASHRRNWKKYRARRKDGRWLDNLAYEKPKRYELFKLAEEAGLMRRKDRRR